MYKIGKAKSGKERNVLYFRKSTGIAHADPQSVHQSCLLDEQLHMTLDDYGIRCDEPRR